MINNKRIECITCGIKYGEVGHMFYVSKKDFYICNICSGKLYHHKVSYEIDSYTPCSIYKAITSQVTGQDEAIKALSITLFKHSLLTNKKIDANFAQKIKTNSLVIGSTGTGKTYIMETAAKILNIPILIVDSTLLTATGYVGDDVENMLSRLIKKSGNIAKAEYGIIVLDEIDKIARREGNYKDIGGESVQQELLRIIGGSEIDVNLDGKKPYSFRTVKFNTSKLLFIGSGCFDGIKNYLTNTNSQVKLFAHNHNDQEDYSTKLRNSIIKYGFIPELIGRFSSIVKLNDLNEENMLNILNHVDGKLIYYKKLMSQYGVSVNISNDAMKAIANYAVKIKIGARAIDDILEKVFNEHIYNIDSYKQDSKIDINHEQIYKIINKKII